jgi:hypothetical protein
LSFHDYRQLLCYPRVTIVTCVLIAHVRLGTFTWSCSNVLPVSSMIQITFGLSPIFAESAPEYVKHSATFLRILFVLSVVTTLASCNNVAPVKILVSRQSYNAVPFVTMEQKKSCSWNIKTHYLRFKHFIITITDDPSPC